MRSVSVLSRHSSRSRLLLGLPIAILAVLPILLSSFWTTLLIEIMILGLFAMSFNLLFGYTGLLSFGHAAYYGAAAYGVGILLSGPIFVPQVNSFVAALLFGVLVGTLLGAIFGAICVQRGDLSFAILTLAFNMLLYEIASQWTSLTGGSDGTLLSPNPVDIGIFTFNPLDQFSYYYFVLAILLGSSWILWRVVNSPYGELLTAIRENPERASFTAVPVKYYQWSAFVISGFFVSIAGSLAATQTYIISPETLHWSKSAEPVIVTLLGGPSIFLGPMIGAVIFVGLEEILTSVTQYWQFGLGIALVLIVIYFPQGVVKELYDTVKEGRVTSRFRTDNPSQTEEEL